MRRLPVYLLLDTSMSMSGEPITAVQRGLDSLLEQLRQDPHALETVYLSVIEFDQKATQTVPLTDLMAFQVPALRPSGRTAMGAALKLAHESIAREVKTTSADAKGDWKPLVFVFTDGMATDDLAPGIQAIQQSSLAALVACAAGEHASRDELSRFATDIVALKGNDARSISEFFAWVSASVAMRSQAVEHGNDANATALPAPPATLDVISLSKD